MKNLTNINVPVSITAIRFDRKMRSIPRCMEWGGRTYRFVDRGISVISKRGQIVSNTITLSDGVQDFCLRQSGGCWTLLGVY